MNIAVVGGGTRCLKLIELVETYKFQEITPKIVAVADIQDDAPGLVKARGTGLYVTHDYHDFFNRDDLEVIMELTGDIAVFNDILAQKKSSVRLIGHSSAVFLWEIARAYAIQEETNQKLKETIAKYNVITNEFIHENFMVIGPDYRILDANASLLHNFSIRRDQAIGRPCYAVTRFKESPCAGKGTPCPLDMVLETRKPSQVTYTLQDDENKVRYYAVSCYPLFENEKLLRVIHISREITKDINFQKAMMQQEKLASIGRLSAGVAHEINNPLTTILTSAMLIQEEMDSDNPLYQDLKTISDEALRCRRIVASLLDFARQTLPTKRLNDLNEVVRDSFMLTKKQATFQDITIELSLAQNLPKINVDKDQIQQCLINLTLNAIEATEAGGQITLTTRWDARADFIEIAVADTGTGIPPENIDRIFDPFFTTTKGGTGLGLAVTHGILEQHGGTIQVESTPGQGTCFTIRLPLEKDG